MDKFEIGDVVRLRDSDGSLTTGVVAKIYPDVGTAIVDRHGEWRKVRFDDILNVITTDAKQDKPKEIEANTIMLNRAQLREVCKQISKVEYLDKRFNEQLNKSQIEVLNAFASVLMTTLELKLFEDGAMHKIAGWIDDHDLTLEEMADRVGVKPSTLIKWLRGYPVKRQYLKRIAAVIGCTVEDLLNDGAI